jgi:hypothetical protein
MFLAQGNAATEQAKFHGVTTNCGTGVLDLGAFDESEDHQALDLGVSRVYGLDYALLAAFE